MNLNLDQNLYLPVVMCTWIRIKRLRKTIKLLEKQKYKNFGFYIWNNNFDAKEDIEKIISCSRIKIHVKHSRENIGGFGRFYWTRELYAAIKPKWVVFLDDDQIFKRTFLSTLIQEAEPKTIKGIWSYQFNESQDYWKKGLVPPGHPAHYCGTGGMIADASIFEHERLYTCPKKFWFIEDLWLSYFASHILGWALIKSSAKVDTVADKKDLFPQLLTLKSEFLHYLIEQGWNVTKARAL